MWGGTTHGIADAGCARPQLKIYDIPEKLVLLVNATPEEERGFAEEVGMRLKVVAHEMPESQR